MSCLFRTVLLPAIAQANPTQVLMQTSTAILPPLMLTLLISSLSYYLIASLLTLSPPTSGLGLVLLGRVHEAKLNWHAHIIRSLLETGFWITIIGFAYFRGERSLYTDSPGMDWTRLITAVAWGTISGVCVVLLGDRWERYLSECGGSIRVRVLNIDSPKHDKVCKTHQEEDSSCNSDALFASIGAFSLLYIFSFIGYHTLSFIFLLPYTLHNEGQNYTCNFFLLCILLATLAGVTFTATATILVRISSTEKVGRLLLSRVTCAGENWRRRTKRSVFELGTWLVVVYGSFYVRFFGWAGLVKSLDAGQFCSSANDHKNEFQDEIIRATWAVVSALQLGTIVGSALVLGEHYCYGEDAIGRHAPQTETTQDSHKAVACCVKKSLCPVRERARKDGLVLFDGGWYSVGKFVPHHPGGAEVLEQYLGTDISFVFRVMHRNPHEIMKHRKPVRLATPDELEALVNRRKSVCQDMVDEHNAKNNSSSSSSYTEPLVHSQKFDLPSFENDTIELYNQFVENGYFKPTRLWIILNSMALFSLLASSIICMKLLPSSWFVIPGILLGLFWHQSGYLMHDAEHHNLAGNECVNDILGWLYGTVCLGVNGAWWREEHREHHAFLNTFDSKGFKDPQMREDIWIQNKKLIPFFGDQMIHFLTNFQHILFLPVIFLAGRVGIVLDSTLTERKFRPWSEFIIV
eukprot:CCRYP_011067-RB/>CCRYP_011067-RB protein AED:0.29 eAED:0.29 QI:272/1/1/1/1/0.66/3/1215/689